jgi:hypothetical protein
MSGFSFRGWGEIAKKDINTVSHFMLTGATATTMRPDEQLFRLAGRGNTKTRVLDFACGVGRNTWGMKMRFPLWSLTGYDCENMLSRSKEYFKSFYGRENYPPVAFNHNWDEVRGMKFDCIISTIALQHICERDLLIYLNDFKGMTDKIVISGRRVNDDGRKNTWGIIERVWGKPTHCDRKGGFVMEGDPEEHFTCVYQKDEQ